MKEGNQTELELVLTKMGNYRLGLFTATPYQHFKNKMIWEVIVYKQIGSDKNPETFDSNRFRIVAQHSSLAAMKAIQSWDTGYLERKAQIKLKTLLKKGDPDNGETTIDSGEEPELHCMELEGDLREHQENA